MSEKQYSFKEIKQICINKRLEGLKIREVQDYLYNELGIDWPITKIKNATRISRNPELEKVRGLYRPIQKGEGKEGAKSKEIKARRKTDIKEGKTERKPKYKKTETGYIVYYGNGNKLIASVEELEKAFQLFCLAGMTMNETARTMGWTRKEFFAAKTAFDITKGEIPLLPETIDELSTDEIAEKIRIAKKKFAIQKIYENKMKDIERTNKKLRSIDHYWNIAVDKINTINTKPFNLSQIEFNDGKVERILALADEHSGALINTPWNEYNFKIMKDRFKLTTQKVLELTEPCTLHIVEAGDSGAGVIHSSILQESENIIDSIFQVTECLIEMILTLLNAGYKIKFLKVTGNHGAVFSDPKARTELTNFERLITWAIKLKLKDFYNFEVIDPICNLGLIKLFDYSVVCTHGTQGGLKQIAGLEKFFKQDNVKEVLAAHIHHQKSESFGDVTVYHLPSFVGLDNYALSKGLYSDAGCRLIEYDKKGRKCEHHITF